MESCGPRFEEPVGATMLEVIVEDILKTRGKF
jgi:hypothetical protein